MVLVQSWICISIHFFSLKAPVESKKEKNKNVEEGIEPPPKKQHGKTANVCGILGRDCTGNRAVLL